MALIDDHSFDDNECRTYLGRNQFGRITLTLAALPVVIPVQYTLAGQDIFLSLRSEQVASALHGSVAALQSDGFDEDAARRWTVLAVGIAQRIGSETGQADATGSFIAANDLSTVSDAPNVDVSPELIFNQLSEFPYAFHLNVKIFSGGWI